MIGSDCQSRLNRYRKHAAWYTDYGADNQVAVIVENHLAYPVIDYALGLAMDEVGKNDSVKQVTNKIPERLRVFIGENGRLVVGAAIVKADNTYCNNGIAGMNSGNVKNFGKIVVRQVAHNGLEEFVVKPVASKIAGDNYLLYEGLCCIGSSIAAIIVLEAISLTSGN